MLFYQTMVRYPSAVGRVIDNRSHNDYLLLMILIIIIIYMKNTVRNIYYILYGIRLYTYYMMYLIYFCVFYMTSCQNEFHNRRWWSLLSALITPYPVNVLHWVIMDFIHKMEKIDGWVIFDLSWLFFKKGRTSEKSSSTCYICIYIGCIFILLKFNKFYKLSIAKLLKAWYTIHIEKRWTNSVSAIAVF